MLIHISSKVVNYFPFNFRFIQLNINGLNVPGRKTQLIQLLKRKQYDAVFLQESKLGSQNKDPVIRGYTLIRLNRPNALNHHSGGGLVIYIKHGISHSEVPLKTIAPLEAQAVSFTDRSKVFSIVNIYRPQLKGKPQRFSEYQYIYDQLPGTDNIVIGDFNAKHTLWGSPATDNNGKQVAEFIEANDLVSLNDGSITYVGAQAGLGSHIDLTLVSSRLAKDCTWEATSETLGSDHVVIEVTLSCNIVKEEVKCQGKWRLGKANWDFFRRHFTPTRLDLGRDDDVSSFSEKLTQVITDAAIGSISRTKDGIARTSPKSSWMAWMLANGLYEGTRGNRTVTPRQSI